jgi:DNA-binding HxlR family transcriptional regulator
MKRPGSKVRGSKTGRPIMALLDILGQRWTLRILWELRNGPLNFRKLRAQCDDVSPTVLNARLKLLREVKIVDLGETGFDLSQQGHELAGSLSAMNKWAEDWARSVD